MKLRNNLLNNKGLLVARAGETVNVLKVVGSFAIVCGKKTNRKAIVKIGVTS